MIFDIVIWRCCCDEDEKATGYPKLHMCTVVTCAVDDGDCEDGHHQCYKLHCDNNRALCWCEAGTILSWSRTVLVWTSAYLNWLCDGANQRDVSPGSNYSSSQDSNLSPVDRISNWFNTQNKRCMLQAAEIDSLRNLPERLLQAIANEIGKAGDHRR